MRILAGTLVLISLLILGSACSSDEVTPSRPESQLPIYRLSFVVDSSARAAFLDHLEVTARRHNFLYRAAPVSPDESRWIAEMEDARFRIIVANDLNPDHFDLRAYENRIAPTPMADLEAYLDELRAALRAVPGVTVSASDDAN